MLQRIITAIFAGFFGTMTVCQFPVLGSTLLPETHAIPETFCVTKVDDTDTWKTEPEEVTALASNQKEAYLETIPAVVSAYVPEQPNSAPVATPLTTTVTTTSAPAETTTQTTETTTVSTAASEETTTQPPETEPAPPVETTAPEVQSEPLDAQSLFDVQQTWFKAYMDYRTITDTSSDQYALQQQAWTDEYGLRRIGDDYLVAMGTGWLTEGCGERFLVTLDSGAQFTVMVGDIKADCHTDPTRRYRACGGGANVLEFIVDTSSMSQEARNAGTVSVYAGLEGNLAEIARISD